MKQTLNVLHIEDDENDSILIRKELSKLNYDIHYEIVDDADALNKALKKNNWDIILSDFSMPSFTGLDALRIIRKQDAQIPVIFVSAAMDEIIVSQTLLEGANDYVGKGNLGRVIEAIRKQLPEVI